MSNYNSFARFYDAVMGDRTDEAEIIESWIKKFNDDANTILELACGTGVYLKYFDDHGYQVTGIDLSKEMLEIAKKRLPNRTLIQADMKSFSFDRKFDVILCLFDSINHLDDFKDWESVFNRVSSHLEYNGLFIFDINTKQGLEDLVNSQGVQKEFDGNKLEMKITRNNDAYDWNVNIFERTVNRNVNVHQEIIREHTFPLEAVKISLESVFKDVKIRTLGDKEITNASKRAYFICLK